MEVLENFTIFTHEQRRWVWLDDLLRYLKKESSDATKPSKVERHLNGYKQSDKIATIEGKKAIPLISLLKFVFHKMDTITPCYEFAKLIETCIYEKTANEAKEEESPLIYDLYKQIAASDIGVHILDHWQPSQDDIKTPFLMDTHKEQFSESEWLKIKVFEVHFGIKWADSRAELIEVNKAKWKMWKAYYNMKSLSGEIGRDIHSVIKQRDKRKEASAQSKKVFLQTKRKHSPNKLEVDLLQRLKTSFPNIQSVVVVDTEKSVEQNMLDVYIELDSTCVPINASEVIQQRLEHKHQCSAQVWYFKQGSMDNYISDGRIARFRFRDDVLLGKLANQVVHLKTPPDPPVQIEMRDDDDDDGYTCSTCFSTDDVAQPLSFETFDVFGEWLLDVPLTIQAFLQNFLNERTIERTANLQAALKQKLQLLYSTYDTLLHTYNKKYLGIFQVANSDELLMGYKSIETVFSVTCSAGATASLNTAEQWLKKKVNEDDLYWASYLKPYLMEYETDAGMVEKYVRMRDCYIIIMVDNLVRLKHKDDPERGENRSKQMCLLPVTIQGLPMDSAVTTSWHDPQICDGSDNCPCKQPMALRKEDIEPALLKLSPDEEAIKRSYEKLCSFGNMNLFTSLIENGMYSLQCCSFVKLNFI